MKIGILSDTHNNLPNLAQALQRLRAEQVDTIIHCGDFTGVETAQMLAGFRVLAAFGNGDIASGEIRAALLLQNPESDAGMQITVRLDGARIAVAHGHIPGVVDELTHCGQYDYVFRGHSHLRLDERVNFTRLINPGALGGLHPQERSFCLLDLQSGQVEFIPLK